MRGICVAEPLYSQIYPQKLGRGSRGTNILDSPRQNPVNITSLKLSTGFLGDKSGIGFFFGSGYFLQDFFLGLGGVLRSREDTKTSLQDLARRRISPRDVRSQALIAATTVEPVLLASELDPPAPSGNFSFRSLHAGHTGVALHFPILEYRIA